MEDSTKPYLIRAIHEWCEDFGHTPYIAVAVDEYTKLPLQFVRNGQIVLNISYEATSNLVINNDTISFKARFSGVSQDVVVPIENVLAIYASENGQGMSFEIRKDKLIKASKPDQETSPKEEPKKGPTLTRLK